MSVATLTLTAAQILALNGTPVQIVAAPGAGKILLPILGTAQYKFNTTAYANVTGAILTIGPSPLAATGQGIEFQATGLIDQTVNTIDLEPVFCTGPQTNWANLALVITNEGGSGEFTTGDGTLVITLWYMTLTLS